MATPSPRRLDLAGPAGRLEALVEFPEEGDPIAVGVVCHPHPLHGGTLDNKVVYTLARAMNELGMATVRFNFRGVAASEGEFDHGEGEQEDVLTVVDWARREFGSPLWLGGFSFGGCMAVRAAGDADAARLVVVAPAVERYGVDAHQVQAPLIVAQGLRDEVIDAHATLRWASRQPGLAHVLEFDDVGHFFHGAQVRLRRELVSTLAQVADVPQEQQETHE